MSKSDSDQIEAGREAWLRIRETGRKSFDDWITVAQALAIGRSVALQEAGTDRPYGVTYTRASKRWLRQAGLDGINDQERSRALLVLQHLPAITIWRAGLDGAQRRKLNHPNAIWRSWRQSTNAEIAKRKPVVPRVTAKAPADTARSHTDVPHPYAKPRAVFWNQDALRRAHQAMLHSRSSDLLTLARVELQAAVRTEADLLELLPGPVQVKTRQTAAPIAAPAALHAA